MCFLGRKGKEAAREVNSAKAVSKSDRQLLLLLMLFTSFLLRLHRLARLSATQYTVCCFCTVLQPANEGIMKCASISAAVSKVRIVSSAVRQRLQRAAAPTKTRASGTTHTDTSALTTIAKASIL